MLELIISALSNTAGIINDKFILTRQRTSIRDFTPALFLFLFLGSAIAAPFLGWLDVEQLLRPLNIFLFLLMIGIAISWNYFYYQGLKKEKVNDFQLIILSAPLATIILSTIFLPAERHFNIIIPAVVASLALIFSHFEKEHLKFDLYSKQLILAVILMGAEAVLNKKLLDFIEPSLLYLLRTGFIFIAFAMFFKPNLKLMANKHIGFIAISGILGVVYMVTRFYGFQEYGVIFTTLILILSPILVYLASAVVLHEKIKTKNIIATIVILACIIYASFAEGI
jgi:drug/metabolite transporter (DMT)-like permease